MSTPVPERTALYRFYDANGTLLYVGISREPDRRWQTHSYSARNTWWPQVSRKTIDWFDSRTEAVSAELTAIREEYPIHNKAGVSSPLVLSSHPATAGVSYQPRERARRPAFEQVADALREAILMSELSPGDRLPSFAECKQHFGITVTTAQRSLRVLKDEGLVEGRAGKGLFVRDEADRAVAVPIGRPQDVAKILREVMTAEHLAALAGLLSGPNGA